MPPLKALHVFDICLATDGEACSLKPPHTELHSILRHHLDSLTPQIINEPGDTKNSVRNFCLELRCTGENDDRLDGRRRQEIKQVLHCTNVPDVLEYRVLKLKFEIKKNLSPVALHRVGKYPTLVVLSFDDEDAEFRNEDVIDLGCPVFHPKGDVVHQVIIRKTEVSHHEARYQCFAAILVCEGTVGAVDTVVTNEKSDGKCKEDIEKRLVVLLPIMGEIQ